MTDAKPIRCLISAGPTREYFDPVRFISNPSSGKMGYALAEAALAKGWQVTLVSGPVALEAPTGVELIKVVTGEEMFTAIDTRFADCDVLIMTAAVCDMRPKYRDTLKVKKDKLRMSIEFEPVIDILKTVAANKRGHQTVVGFAAETDDVLEHAQQKLINKRCDYIVANQVGHSASAFESDSNSITIIGADGTQAQAGPAPKLDIAKHILDTISVKAS